MPGFQYVAYISLATAVPASPMPDILASGDAVSIGNAMSVLAWTLRFDKRK